MSNKYLSIYLNDHLAMMVGTEELVSRSLESNQGSELGQLLQAILMSTQQDRTALEALMDDQTIAQNRAKTSGAWLAERVGRLKLNGEIKGYSDLSRLVEIEGIDVALEGKGMFWDTLCRLGFREAGGKQTRSMADTAQQQLDQLEGHRMQAAEQALGLVGSLSE